MHSQLSVLALIKYVCKHPPHLYTALRFPQSVLFVLSSSSSSWVRPSSLKAKLLSLWQKVHFHDFSCCWAQAQLLLLWAQLATGEPPTSQLFFCPCKFKALKASRPAPAESRFSAWSRQDTPGLAQKYDPTANMATKESVGLWPLNFVGPRPSGLWS